LPLSELAHRPVRVHQLHLRGLVIQVPPKRKANEAQTETAHEEKREPPEHPKQPDREKNKSQDLLFVETIYADGTLLKILPGKPDRDPLIFELYKLKLQHAAQSQPMQFQALLKNAKPPGLIQTNGTFGPWAKDDPGATPVTGNYKFEK